jgi:aspartate racemase
MGEHSHPEITMHTHPLSDYMVHIRAGDWKKVADLMLSSTRKVAQAGADLVICPDNTIHQAFEYVLAGSPLPWVHIAENVAENARQSGYSRLAVLGTKYLMTGPVYPDALTRLGISFAIPEEDDRERIDEIIFKELVNGLFLDDSRGYFNRVIQELKTRGCDAVVLACTEIPLIVDPGDCPLPTLDSTRLLARAALRIALEKDAP